VALDRKKSEISRETEHTPHFFSACELLLSICPQQRESMVHRSFFWPGPALSIKPLFYFLALHLLGEGWWLLPVTYSFCVIHGTHAAKKSDGSGRPQFDGIPLAPFLLSTFTPRIFIGFPRPADFFPASAAQTEPAEILTTKEKSRPLTCR
jgi:hypothetical protein